MTKSALPVDRVDGYELKRSATEADLPKPTMLDIDPSRMDGYVNCLTGIGSASHDKTLGGNPFGLPFLVRYMSGQEAEDRWRGSDLGSRIVETRASQMMREGWELTIQGTEEDGGSAGDTDPDDPDTRADMSRRQRRKDFAPGGGDAPMPPVAEKHVPGEINTSDGEESQQVEDMNAKLEQLKAAEAFRRVACYEQCYGGGAILMGIDDGKKLWEPLDKKNIKDITHLTVLRGGWDGEVIAAAYYTDITAPKYGEVRIYQIRNIGMPVGAVAIPGEDVAQVQAQAGRTNQANTPGVAQGPGIGYYVHESRLLVFPGKPVSNQARFQMRGWGDGVFTRVDEILSNYNQTWGGVAILMQEWAQGNLSIPGLAATLASEAPDDQNKIMNRALMLNMTQSIARARLLDSEEKFTREVVPLGGIGEVLMQFALRLAAAVPMPVSLLMGQAPAGLNATGDADIRFFYDDVAAEQQRCVLPCLRLLMSLLFVAKKGPTAGVEPERWSVAMKALYQMSAAEDVDLQNKQQMTDVGYITAGVLTPEEVAASRFGGSKYSTVTTIDVEGRAKLAADRKKQLAAKRPPVPPPSGGSGPIAADKGDPEDPESKPSSTGGGKTTINIHTAPPKSDNAAAAQREQQKRIAEQKRRNRNPLHRLTAEEIRVQEEIEATQRLLEEGGEAEEPSFDPEDYLDSFDPDEPRDSDGKWGAGGAGGAGRPAWTESRRPVISHDPGGTGSRETHVAHADTGVKDSKGRAMGVKMKIFRDDGRGYDGASDTYVQKEPPHYRGGIQHTRDGEDHGPGTQKKYPTLDQAKAGVEKAGMAAVGRIQAKAKAAASATSSEEGAAKSASPLGGEAKASLSSGHAPEFAAMLDKHESHLVTLKRERGEAYDASGKHMSSFLGKKSEVEVPTAALVRMKGGTFTHNHPGTKYTLDGKQYSVAGSLSQTDVETASKFDLKEVRAVASTVLDGKQQSVAYIMRRPEGGWPNHETIRDTVDRHVAGAQVRARAAIAATSNPLEKIEHSVSPLHEAWKQTSKELGLDYERVVLK